MRELKSIDTSLHECRQTKRPKTYRKASRSLRGSFLIIAAMTAVFSGCAMQPPLDQTASERLNLKNVSCDTDVQPEQQVELDLIDRLMKSGDKHAALAQLESKPLATEGHWLRYGQLLATTGNLKKAHAVFQSLVNQCHTGRAEHGLGMVLLKENEVDEARIHLRIARELDPADADVRNDYGYVLLLVGDYKKAAFELRTAMELGDGKGPVRENLAVAYMLTDNWSGLQWMQQKYDLTEKEKDYAKKLADQFRRAK